jgi:acetyl esterase/lipase
MSLRAEIVRLALRRFMKRRSWTGASLAETRRGLAAAERFVPRPPAAFETSAIALGGVPAQRITPPRARDGRHILFLHGGGYVSGSAQLYRNLTWRFAGAAGAPLYFLDYRLAPEHPFPAAVDDAFDGYCGLVDLGADARQIVLLGDSAGGGLVFALLLRLRDAQAPLPGAVVALSPWTDLALTGESLRRNAEADPMLEAAAVPRLAEFYLVGADPRTPWASPLYGDLAGMPPSLIEVGSDEILLDDSVRLAERLEAAGSPVTLEIWPRMPHV